MTLIGSCATPYQARGISGGYEDVQLGPGLYYVEVQVNGYTSRVTAIKYLHRRAWELCWHAGYERYAVSDEQQSANVSYVAETTHKPGSSKTTVSTVEKPVVAGYVHCSTPRSDSTGYERPSSPP
jgi:hypothetical protein